MTIPREEAQALNNTRAFLFSLLRPKKTPRVPKEIRERAYQMIKHFPDAFKVKSLYKNRIKRYEKEIKNASI